MQPATSLLRGVALLTLLCCVPACTHLAIEDCGDSVLGRNEPRIRSSHFRMLLADPPAAAHRVAPYAAMSTLAYTEDADCGPHEPGVTAEERTRLEAMLLAEGWTESRDVAWSPPCEDEVGLFFRVWTRDGTPRDVVVAFRGTWGFKDWSYGNLHWLTRFLPMEDQYSSARAAMLRVFDRYSTTNQGATRFRTTGHSLGGGLAQHALYSYPTRVSQAFVFDPSSVTGFVEQSRSGQVAACNCSAADLDGEARIYRVYDAYEVLSSLRIFHKTFLPPERHIQEVRFPNAASHSMKGLAFYLLETASASPAYTTPWYSGHGRYTTGEPCTAAFTRRQRDSCDAQVGPNQWNTCPQ